jgi:hypothetical protein
MQVSKRTALRPEKSLLFSCATTYREFIEASPRQEFYEIRSREIRLLPEVQAYCCDYPDPVNWLIVAADETPDTLVVLPVLAHIANLVPRLALRVVNEEDASTLLSALVDDESLLASWADADLPLLLGFDDEWQFQEQWGPHPQAIDPWMDAWLAEHREIEQVAEDESPEGQAAYARLLDNLTYEMRLWYNSALNQACAEEICAILARWRSDSGDDTEE